MSRAVKMNDEYLFERGYKQYPPTPVLDSEYITAKFQKIGGIIQLWIKKFWMPYPADWKKSRWQIM